MEMKAKSKMLRRGFALVRQLHDLRHQVAELIDVDSCTEAEYLELMEAEKYFMSAAAGLTGAINQIEAGRDILLAKPKNQNAHA